MSYNKSVNMKKNILLIVIVSVITVSCDKKAIPVITARTTEPLPPAKKLINVKPDMELGKTIFTNRCGRCHDLPKPEQYTAQRWDGILSYMIPRARLNEEQGIHITAYLKGNAIN